MFLECPLAHLSGMATFSASFRQMGSYCHRAYISVLHGEAALCTGGPMEKEEAGTPPSQGLLVCPGTFLEETDSEE